MSSINDKLDKILSVMEHGRKSKYKDLKLPFNVRVAYKRMLRKNRLLVFFISSNLNISAGFGQLDNGMIEYRGCKYGADTDSIGLWNGRVPCVILCEWNNQPVSCLDFKKINDTSSAQKIILRSMELKEAEGVKKKFKIGGLIGIIIAVIVVGYIFFNGV